MFYHAIKKLLAIAQTNKPCKISGHNHIFTKRTVMTVWSFYYKFSCVCCE